MVSLCQFTNKYTLSHTNFDDYPVSELIYKYTLSHNMHSKSMSIAGAHVNF